MDLFMKRFRGLPVDFLMNWFVISSPRCSAGNYIRSRGPALVLTDAGSWEGGFCPVSGCLTLCGLKCPLAPGLFPRKHVCRSHLSICSAPVICKLLGDGNKSARCRGGHR